MHNGAARQLKRSNGILKNKHPFQMVLEKKSDISSPEIISAETLDGWDIILTKRNLSDHKRNMILQTNFYSL